MLQLTTILFLIAFSLLAVVHYIALQLYLYWKFEWFDIPMHVLGGAVVVLGLYTLYDLRIIVPRHFLRVVPTLAAVFIIASIWEVFQVFAGIATEENYIFDTARDLTMGLLGGYIGFIVGDSIRKLP